MNVGFYHQLLSDLIQADKVFALPKLLKDAVRQERLDSIEDLDDVLSRELRESGYQGPDRQSYFSFLAGLALRTSFFKGDFGRFDQFAELIEKRISSLNGDSFEKTDGLEALLSFLNAAKERLRRRSNVEEFERLLDELEWGEFDPKATSAICLAIGVVYMAEPAATRRSKSRFWLQRAVGEGDASTSWTALCLLGQFYIQNLSQDNLKRLGDLQDQAFGVMQGESGRQFERSGRRVLLDLKLRNAIGQAVWAAQSDQSEKPSGLEAQLGQLREWASILEKDDDSKSPVYQGNLKMILGEGYLRFAGSVRANELKRRILLHASSELGEAINLATLAKDHVLKANARKVLLQVQIEQGAKQAEKDLKELLGEVRKGAELVELWEVSQLYAAFYLAQNQGGQKAYEVLMDTMRRGLKRLDEGGSFLVVKSMVMIHRILVEEVARPGISWVVSELEAYFNLVTEVIEALDSRLEVIGMEEFKEFQAAYATLLPATHHQIKVYLRYQFQAIRMLRLTAAIHEDENSLKVADNLLAELTRENNPLTFIRAAWAEFKDVPFEVRNKVVNKCISITKGDLPAAAEHLDFSYRNLRSYITFEEVNRLGFFLDEQQTGNRQLEQGIRLMFHDLYKSGTIFEVVFDMPKFLVEHVKSGFSSQDLEEALDIKGTTAKKYIKIMMEIGLVDLDHNEGRKLFYRVRKDNIMTRFGKEQKAI